MGVTGASAARFALLVAEVGEPTLPLVSASADVQACILAVGSAFFLAAHASCLFARLFAGASRVLRIEATRSLEINQAPWYSKYIKQRVKTVTELARH